MTGMGSVRNHADENLAGLSVTEILHFGRERVARAKAESEAAQRDIVSEDDV